MIEAKQGKFHRNTFAECVSKREEEEEEEERHARFACFALKVECIYETIARSIKRAAQIALFYIERTLFHALGNRPPNKSSDLFHFSLPFAPHKLIPETADIADIEFKRRVREMLSPEGIGWSRTASKWKRSLESGVTRAVTRTEAVTYPLAKVARFRCACAIRRWREYHLLSIATRNCSCLGIDRIA